ncbi:hypothetical protein BDW67DRAFT_20782 [Aspergillus spinulosporus]
MPLHLLGKKSWNVYNPENIARVRRDEAQAKAQEEEDERRMQEVDAERRIRILRGESPPPPLPSSQKIPQAERRSRADYAGGHRKRRRLVGEDDTDRDIRLAREDAELALAKREELVYARKSENDAPLHDSDGHINLFPEVKPQRQVEKNPEAVKEAADRKRCYEDQYTMRFSNAAGFRQDVGKNPWYSSSHGDGFISETMSNKDVWGNEDPLRKEREKARIDLNDPLAAMKKGIHQLKSVEEQRKKWNQERSRELDALKSAEEARSRHRRRRSDSKDSLENFRLDNSPDTSRKERNRKPERHHRHSHDRSSTHSHRRRSHSRSGSRSHHHRSHSHRHRHHNSRDSCKHETGLDTKHRS